MKRLAAIPILLALSVLAACATGPDYTEARSGIPAVAPDKGRVYIYRDNQIFGIAVQPAITMQGRAIGPCQPGGVYFFDLPAGEYRASVGTEVERYVDFEVVAGEEKFIRCYVGPGLLEARAYLELVAGDTARGKISSLTFLGRSPAF